MPEGEFTQTVQVCPRCGWKHRDVLWTPLDQPKVFLQFVFTHSAVCPVKVEPLFMEARIR